MLEYNDKARKRSVVILCPTTTSSYENARYCHRTLAYTPKSTMSLRVH